MYTPYNSPPKFYIKFTLNSKTTNLKGKKTEFRFKPEDSHACAYVSETLTLIEEAIRRTNAFEMWCYRRMFKISWRRFMSNNKILEIVREDRYFMKKIVERKFEFAVHILRGSSGRLMTRVLEGRIEGKRGVGRQRIMWLDDIKRWSPRRGLFSVKIRKTFLPINNFLCQ